MTVPIAIPISLTCLILIQTCPPFSFIMKKGELVGLLTVYADDQDVEVTILVHPGHRRQIARALFTSFERGTASFPIRSVTFQTERIF